MLLVQTLLLPAVGLGPGGAGAVSAGRRDGKGVADFVCGLHIRLGTGTKHNAGVAVVV